MNITELKQQLDKKLAVYQGSYMGILLQDCRTALEQQEQQIAELNKFLTLKLDAMPSGLSAGQSNQIEDRLQVVENAAAQLIYAIRRGVDQEELGEAMAACEKAIQSKEPK